MGLQRAGRQDGRARESRGAGPLQSGSDDPGPDRAPGLCVDSTLDGVLDRRDPRARRRRQDPARARRPSSPARSRSTRSRRRSRVARRRRGHGRRRGRARPRRRSARAVVARGRARPGSSRAIRAGLPRADRPRAVLLGDLPALRPRTLAVALDTALEHRARVRRRMPTAPARRSSPRGAGSGFVHRFGAGSARAHRDARAARARAARGRRPCAATSTCAEHLEQLARAARPAHRRAALSSASEAERLARRSPR